MAWWKTVLLVAALFLLGWLADTWLGPFGSRVTDREETDEQVRLVAVATRFPDMDSLLDFLDGLKTAEEEKRSVAIDIVRGRRGANLQAMEATSPEVWNQRLLLRYRRQGTADEMRVSPTVPGLPSR